MTPNSISNYNNMIDTMLAGAGRSVASNDPVLKSMLDTLFQMFLGRDVSALGGTGKMIADVLGGFLSSTFGLGRSQQAVSAFGSLSSTLAGMPMQITSVNNKGYTTTGTSRGMGINSISIAQQIASHIQHWDKQYLASGLNSDTLIGAVSSFMRDQGRLDGVMEMTIDPTSTGLYQQLGLDTNGNYLPEERRNEVSKKMSHASMTHLKRMAKIMKIMEDANASPGELSEALKNDIKGTSDNFTEEEILAADKARSGKMSATFLSNDAEVSFRLGIRKHLSTIKTMSELFRTDDFQQLEEQARQFGIKSITTENGAKQVQRLTREAMSVAMKTGRTTDEVLSNLGTISAMQASMNGGSASVSNTLFMQNAYTEAEMANKNNVGLFNAEDKMAISANQLTEANDEMSRIYAAQEAFRIAEKRGQLSSKDKDAISDLNRRMERISKLAPHKRREAFLDIEEQMIAKAQSLGFNTDSEQLQRAGIANAEFDGTSTYLDVVGADEIRKDLADQFDMNDKLKSSRFDKVSEVAEILRQNIGGDDTLWEQYITAASKYSRGKMKKEKFMEELQNMGFTARDAGTLLDAKLNVTELNTISTSRDNRRQNWQSKGAIAKRQEKADEEMRYMMDLSDLSTTKNRSAHDFLLGFMDNGGFTSDENVGIYLGSNLRREDISKRLDVGEIKATKTKDGKLKIDENNLKFGGYLQKLLAKDLTEEEWKEKSKNVDWINKKLEEVDGQIEFTSKGAPDEKGNTSGSINVITEQLDPDAKGLIRIGQLTQKGKLTKQARKNLKSEKVLDELVKTLSIKPEDKKRFKKDLLNASKEGLEEMNSVINNYTDGRGKLTVSDTNGLYVAEKAIIDQKMVSTRNKLDPNGVLLRVAAAFGKDVVFDNKTGNVSYKIPGLDGEHNLVENLGVANGINKETREVNRFVSAIKEDPSRLTNVMKKAAEGDKIAQKGLEAMMYHLNSKAAKGTKLGTKMSNSKTKVSTFNNWMDFWQNDMGIDISNLGEQASEHETENGVRAGKIDELVSKTLDLNLTKDKDGNWVTKHAVFGRSKGKTLTQEEYNNIKDSLAANIGLSASMYDEKETVEKLLNKQNTPEDWLKKIYNALTSFFSSQNPGGVQG